MFENPIDWAQDHGVRIVIILALAVVAHAAAKRLIPRTVRLGMEAQRGKDDQSSEEHDRRVETLSRVFLRTLDVVLLVVVVMLVLAEVGVSLAPLIASVSIVGIAIGFGAQSLVRDALAGSFILLEDQFRRGDIVSIAGITGQVESFTLRRTVLRDLDGAVHTVPNGEISVSSNRSRGWSRVNLNVGVGYGENLERVREVLDAVGSELAADPDWEPLIVEAPSVLRVDSFGDSAVEVKVLAVTEPGKQWQVTGELRRRIKARFDAEGIEIPFPQRVVTMRREAD